MKKNKIISLIIFNIGYTADRVLCFSCTVFTIHGWLNLQMWNPQIQGAELRDLSICGFWYPGGPGTNPLQIPRDNCMLK